jgi:quinohemoprotein ethanol dehydrogenase
MAGGRAPRPVVTSLLAAVLLACRGGEAARTVVDDAALADTVQGENWLAFGRTSNEQRFSPLTQITDANVGSLAVDWSLDLPGDRGLGSTPLVVDGVLYFIGSMNIVRAVDATSGALLWTYDPRTREYADRLRAGWDLSRGIAFWNGKVYVATWDGRLNAVDAGTGTELWSVQTIDPALPMYITGAPKVFKGKVLVGNGGTENGPSRGYVSAYDAETGEVAWRFWIVPGNPADGFENDAMRMAAETWTGEWWIHGGGGNAWHGFTYDAELDQLYIGTGNGSPWNRKVRSPGGGDNLFLCSILALEPDDGTLVWHYQTTPGDTWDYTSTQQIMLADLTIGGAPRKVLMQAPKNGFFYVLDRATGALLSAENYVEVSWATGIDEATGRPIEAADLDYREAAQTVKPSPLGGHNWQPMSFSPKTGLVYIPANDVAWVFGIDRPFTYRPGTWNTGTDPRTGDAMPRAAVSGRLIAWDPVGQRKAWEVPYPEPWNGGTLATAGGLVFQGTAHGTFAAYDAATGTVLWERAAGTGVMAGPSTYQLDGEQYVAVMAGWGGAFGLVGGDAAAAAHELAGANRNDGRLLVFKLGGTAAIPVTEAIDREVDAISGDLDPEQVRQGNYAYHRWCWSCHGIGGVAGGVLPDLRKSELFFSDALEPIVLEGTLLAKGMPNLSQWVTKADLALIRSYVTAKRNELSAEQAGQKAEPAAGASARGDAAEQ